MKKIRVSAQELQISWAFDERHKDKKSKDVLVS
jgi:hypothetical protein